MVRERNRSSIPSLHSKTTLTLTLPLVASFILFSTPGSGNNMITVFAESRVNAERTLRALNHLVSAEGFVWIAPLFVWCHQWSVVLTKISLNH